MSGVFPDVDKCVVAVVPHTHWMDFFLGLVVRSAIGKEINYIGKKSLFKPPFGWFFRWTGGAPVDRSKNSNTVDSVAALFETWLDSAAEQTRERRSDVRQAKHVAGGTRFNRLTRHPEDR